jgi:Arc/MetJ family transcription regulator
MPHRARCSRSRPNRRSAQPGRRDLLATGVWARQRAGELWPQLLRCAGLAVDSSGNIYDSDVCYGDTSGFAPYGNQFANYACRGNPSQRPFVLSKGPPRVENRPRARWSRQTGGVPDPRAPRIVAQHAGPRCVSRALAEVYACCVATGTTKRTNINLDKQLVDEAAAVLGTAQTTETVHAALREVVDRAARRRLAGQDFPGLTPAALGEIRRPRKFA